MINALPAGHILQNEYKIEKVLGVGGFGITYLARDTNLNHLVVIKEFLPQDMATRDQSRINVTPFTKDTQSYNHLLKRFSEEAQLLAKMRHPNIVKVTRFFKANNTAYFVMEYTEGETLKEYLQKNNTMSEEEMLSIMMPILEGAKYVHEQGFLHRDIAPDNIYLTKNGMPILIDFGAARDAIAEESKNISSIVKEGYSSPEQYTINNKQNASSDIYALGAVFYRLIVGKVPTNAPHRQTALLNDVADPIGDIAQEYKNKYSQVLLHAVKKALNIRATDRFSSVGEFQKALTGTVVVDSKPRTSRHVASTTQANKKNENKSSGNTGLIVVLVLVSLLLFAGIAYTYMDKSGEQVTQIPVSTTKKIPVATPVSSTNDELEKAKRDLAELKRQQVEAEKQRAVEKERERQEVEAERLKKEREEVERLKAEQRVELESLRREKAERERVKTQSAAAKASQSSSTSQCTNYIVDTIQLNVRDRPGTPSNIVGRVQNGDRVCVYEVSGKWGRISRGWISGKYLKKDYSTAPNRGNSSKTKTMNFNENGIAIAVSYPAYVRKGEAFTIQVSMANNKSYARMGGLTLSFPDMISMSGEGLYNNFDKLNGYTPPSKLYSSITKGNMYSKYFVIEGWQNKWPYGTTKSFSVRLTAPLGVNYLRVNVRGVLHTGKSKRSGREVIIPTYSDTTDQQGYYAKQFSIAIQ